MTAITRFGILVETRPDIAQKFYMLVWAPDESEVEDEFFWRLPLSKLPPHDTKVAKHYKDFLLKLATKLWRDKRAEFQVWNDLAECVWNGTDMTHPDDHVVWLDES